MTHEHLTLDADGIPILTDPVGDDVSSGAATEPVVIDTDSAADIALQLLDSESFMRQLDDIAEELTYTIREQLENALQPVIDAAVADVLNDSTVASTVAIRDQLESRLPDIIARTLRNTPSDT